LETKEDRIQYKGYCPVTLKDGPGKDPETGEILPIQTALRRPQYDSTDDERQYIVEYEGNLYRMLDAEKLDRFMRTPWEFTGLKLPVKLPFDKQPVDLAKLPLVGYLEQTVADNVTEGLLELGRACPRFPGLGNKESGLKFMALYLRTHNPRNTGVDTRLHSQNLKRFRKACELLVREAKGPSLPQPLPPGHDIVEEFMVAISKGPKGMVTD